MNFKDILPQLQFTDAPSGEAVITYITNKWQQEDRAFIVHFIYYASYVLMQEDEGFQQSMVLADHILIDGIGMQMYCKRLIGHTPNNLNGTDLGPLWINYLTAKNVPICLYGTTPESLQKAADHIHALGNNCIHYFQDGFSPLLWDKIPDRAALFIGKGTPKQENWVRENIDIIRAKKLLVITVGGFFDFLSGFYTRAPLWVRKIKMEWAWRTILHPQRHLGKRKRDLTIFYKPARDKKRGYDQLFKFCNIS